MSRKENIGYSNQMMSAATNCSRFTKRGDVDMFNMTDYRSCENCRHMSEDNRCVIEDNSHDNTGGGFSIT